MRSKQTLLATLYCCDPAATSHVHFMNPLQSWSHIVLNLCVHHPGKGFEKLKAELIAITTNMQSQLKASLQMVASDNTSQIDAPLITAQNSSKAPVPAH